MNAILLVDHGSRKREANDMLTCMANLVQTMAGADIVVRSAHMEIAEPTVEQGFTSCVDAGATHVIVFPYMLSPGRHSTADIPRMIAGVACNHEGVTFLVTPAFGVHEKLGEIILGRAGLPVVHALSADEANRCWDPSCSEKLCGEACRAIHPSIAATPEGAATETIQ
jgi:sirohydrochlorin ferrochelatase